MIEQITDNNLIIAIIIRSQYKKEGIEFFTPDYFSQQLGYMNRPKGYKVEAHSHKKVEKKIFLTQEVLYVKSGKVKIFIFNNDHIFLQEIIISAGDIILLANGGHGLEMMENSELFEVKQGPYGGEEDKIRFIAEKRNYEQKSIY